jgi:hypothetical protein
MKLFILSFCFLNILKECISLNIVPSFLKKSPIYHEINDLLISDIKVPFILNGDTNQLKKNLCYFIAQNNNINFKEYTFDKFMLNLPYSYKDNSLIYINDFLVKNGRVLNSYEEEVLLYLSKSSNLVIFESDNIETISIKDIDIIRKFKILQFPKIDKKKIIQHIYDIINTYNYNSDLYLFNWHSYNIEKLTFENINILLFEINNMVNESQNFNFIHASIPDMINSLNDDKFQKYLNIYY